MSARSKLMRKFSRRSAKVYEVLLLMRRGPRVLLGICRTFTSPEKRGPRKHRAVKRTMPGSPDTPRGKSATSRFAFCSSTVDQVTTPPRSPRTCFCVCKKRTYCRDNCYGPRPGKENLDIYDLYHDHRADRAL